MTGSVPARAARRRAGTCAAALLVAAAGLVATAASGASAASTTTATARPHAAPPARSASAFAPPTEAPRVRRRASELERLLVRYLRTERWLARRVHEEGDANALVVASDALGPLSALFFAGRLDEVGTRLDAAILAIAGPHAERLDGVLDLELVNDGRAIASATSPSRAIALHVLTGDGTTMSSLEVPAGWPAGTPVALPPDPAGAPPGHRRVVADVGPVGAPHSVRIEVGRFTTAIDGAARAGALRVRLDALDEALLPATVRLTRARLDLLATLPRAAAVHPFAIDAGALARELDADVAALERGEDPLRTFVGDRWIALRLAGADVPCRVIVPPAARTRAAPPPLLVALHGAGGNEHLFVDGHAGGRLVDLARARGMVVVSPRTTALLAPGAWTDLLDEIARIVGHDPARVRVIGHSMGGMTAGVLASRHPRTIERAALVAGAPRTADAASPPLLVAAGGRDRVIPAGVLRAARDRMRERGVPVAWIEAGDADHLLVVPAVLDRAFAWLCGEAIGVDADVP